MDEPKVKDESVCSGGSLNVSGECSTNEIPFLLCLNLCFLVKCFMLTTQYIYIFR